MAGLGPALAIEAPALTPPPNGLLNTASVIDRDDDRWMTGVQYQGDACGDVTIFDPCSSNSDIVTTFTDGATTSGSPNLSSASAEFNPSDVGQPISGTGIPAGAIIISVTSTTVVVLSANATATATGVTLTMQFRPLAAGRPNKQSLQPFGVQAYDKCSTFGFGEADYEGRARRALAARETTGVEREFWTGSIMGGNPHLADVNNQQLNSGTAYGLRSGLAALVQAIADNRLGQGMIHARPSLVTHWSALNMLVWRNNKLYTFNGNLVVPGSGYTGGARDGTPPTANAEWAYVTDVVQVGRGPVDVFATEADRHASMNRLRNYVTVRAQRMYEVEGNFCAIVGAKFDTTSTS